MRWRRPALLALLLLTGASPGARALQAPPPRTDPANFRGRVVVDSTAIPIRGAFVELVGTVLRCVTDSVGAFEILAIPAGTYVVRVRAAGFLQEFFEIEAEDGLDLEGVIALKRAAGEARSEQGDARSLRVGGEAAVKAGSGMVPVFPTAAPHHPAPFRTSLLASRVSLLAPPQSP